MSDDYLASHGGTRVTDQREKARAGQVKNSAGGYVFEIDDVARLRRFLILGSEGGSYYATERELTLQNIDVVRRMAEEGGDTGQVLVSTIVAISDAGRAPSNDPALFALATALSLGGDHATKLAAGKALPTVARTGTHLFKFVTYAEGMRGWGTMLKKAIEGWYLAMDTPSLAYDAVKYRGGRGSSWTHRDLLRKVHPDFDRATQVDRHQLHQWIVDPDGELIPEVRAEVTSEDVIVHPDAPAPSVPTMVWESVIDPYPVVRAFRAAQNAPTAADTAALLRSGARLPREALNTDHLTDPDVWKALLEQRMPIHALTRNLATMTRLGVLTDHKHRGIVLDALTDAHRIQKSRLHPLALLVAMSTYAAGHGMRGTNTWTPIGRVTDALDQAFYLAFPNVEPTGRRILVAVDVSGSMDTGYVAGSPLTPREAAAALAMVTISTEDNADVVAFSAAPHGHNALPGQWTKPRNQQRVWHGYHHVEDGITPVGISSRQRLDDVTRLFAGLPMGGTDCSLPMQYALDTGRDYDAFVILTDNETWAGGIHPFQALKRYREKTGIPARLAVVAMTATNFSIADPSDPGMLDVVGFDTATPTLISEFIDGAV